MKYIDSEKLITEIEKRITEKEKFLVGFSDEDYASSIAATQDNIMVGLCIAKKIIIDANTEQSSEDLGKEIKRFLSNATKMSKGEWRGEYHIGEIGFRAVARHFYKLGKQWQKEQMLNYVQGKYDAYQEEYDDYYAGLRVAYGDMVKKLKED